MGVIVKKRDCNANRWICSPYRCDMHLRHAGSVSRVRSRNGKGEPLWRRSSSSPWLINGRMTAENATLRMILRAAYGLTALQINGPDWLDSDRFDLEAKSPPGVPDSELMPMLQSLLKERFQLTAHRETKKCPCSTWLSRKEA